MRHSDPRLTLGVYAHIGLAETSAAINALPKIAMKRRQKEPLFRRVVKCHLKCHSLTSIMCKRLQYLQSGSKSEEAETTKKA